MSKAVLRRNSSKQGLQNLLRLTAQRSVEDAEEVERERRRRSREQRRRDSGGGGGYPEDGTNTEENMYEGGLKPSSSPSLEEDEGFSDIVTQRRDKQRLRLEQEEGMSTKRLERQERMDGEVDGRRECEQVLSKRRDDMQRPNTEEERKKEVKISYTSKVFLQNEPKPGEANGHVTNQEVTSQAAGNKKTKRANSRSFEPKEEESVAAAILESEQTLCGMRQGLQQKENHGLDHLKHRQAEAEAELEELKKKRMERRRVREEEERRREEEEALRLHREEEEKRRMKEEMERRRVEAAERMKSLSSSSVDGGEEIFCPFSPKTPTHKITERTESLNRSLKKSNSFKKTQPLGLLPKIDDKLEQYAHAVEHSHDPRSVKASLSDLPHAPEVSTKKNLFEAGEVWSQHQSKTQTCKDTEGLKVGVAGLITQWVRGPNDEVRQSPSKPADVKPGDVMQKKNMWEGIGDSTGHHGNRNKNSAAGKKYKFVVTGHGKYEKIPVEDGYGEDFANGTNDMYHGDY